MATAAPTVLSGDFAALYMGEVAVLPARQLEGWSGGVQVTVFGGPRRRFRRTPSFGMPAFFVSHSQTTIAVHPVASMRWIVIASRSTFRQILACQNGGRVSGERFWH